MQAFKKHTGKTAAIFQPNIDTDQILPKQFLKRITKNGYGNFLFFDWRFDEQGNEKPDFVLNQPRFRDASILLAGKNFGSGSSREHAPWSLADFGFRVVIAPSFGEIFYNNCFKIGLLPIILEENLVAELVEKTEKIENYLLTVDLEKLLIFNEKNFSVRFATDEFRRECLLNGWDDIGLILKFEDKISEFELKRPLWTFFLNENKEQ
ncbi:MAG TPA: 3-isopropylmalate dehydratase small subunit [Pyrinomonadaceae bacterium]|nr:3-isopropylmalate dehydratase small subunit [Pyrinomonadaceae bacterium]